jgi:hypothetical protein
MDWLVPRGSPVRHPETGESPIVVPGARKFAHATAEPKNAKRFLRQLLRREYQLLSSDRTIRKASPLARITWQPKRI